MVEIMYWLMFLACVAVLVMAIFVLLYQREVNINLKRKYDDLTRELNNCFGRGMRRRGQLKEELR